MLKIKEYVYHNEEERKFLENRSIGTLIESLFEDIGDIFDKKIAFKISKELIPPYQDDNYNIIKGSIERITLEQIPIQEIKLDIPQPIIKSKYNFKERIKILFKGKSW